MLVINFETNYFGSQNLGS